MSNLPDGSNQLIGVDADADTLLKTLSDLAKEGEPALCNANYLEKKLNIEIASPRLSGSEDLIGALADVKPRSPLVKFSAARYGTSDNKKIKSCYLSIDFGREYFCEAGSMRIQNILGEAAQYDSPPPGRASQGRYYRFKPLSGAFLEYAWAL